MSLDQADLEGSAEALYKLAGLPVDDAVSPTKIARALFGARAVEILPMRMAAGALIYVNGERRIVVKQGLDMVTTRFVVGHELGHWILEREGYRGDHLEAYCDYIGGAILMPRRSFVGAHRFHDGDVTDLAAEFGVTHSATWLRIGEAVRIPIALSRPGLVRTRGPDSWVWPESETIVKWARGTPPPGLAKVRVEDDRRRMVLVGDDDG